MFPDLTLAMQKLYQTFVAEAAQLQSVHENVKVGSVPLTLSLKGTQMTKMSCAYQEHCPQYVC